MLRKSPCMILGALPSVFTSKILTSPLNTSRRVMMFRLPMLIRFGEFEFDKARRRLTRNGHPVHLIGQALDLLELLLNRRGELLSREEIRSALWPGSRHDLEHSLDVLLNRLRRILGDRGNYPEYIETVPRRGFRFLCPVVVDQNSYGDSDAAVNQPLPRRLP